MANLPVDLQSNEELLAIYRRHVIFLLQNLIGRLLLILILVIAAAILGPLTGPGLIIIAGVVGIVVLVLLVQTYFIWYRYQNDVWVVTNQRLIDSLKRNWFHHEISSTDLINVEDMSVTRSGMFQTMFNYGDLKCQTAGAEDNFVLVGIPEPSKALDTIDSARDTARRSVYQGASA